MCDACQGSPALCSSSAIDDRPLGIPAAARAARARFTFDIPAADAALYARKAPVETMTECRTLLGAMRAIHAAKKILPECNRLAQRLNRRWSPDTLRSLYYKFIGALPNAHRFPPGDWRILLNKSKARVDNSAHCADRFRFHEFWRSLGERHHQDWAAAHAELLQIFKTGCNFDGKRYNQIPGYTAWPKEDSATGHPRGWSYSVLMRHQSSPYDQTAARIGFSRAALQRVPVLTSRVGLDVGQFFEYDDHEFNQKLLYQRKPMRPIGFGVIDIFSDCDFMPSFKPTLWDLEEEKKRKLTQREFMWYIVAIHTTIGYRADLGTENIIERGTATYSQEFEDRLARVSNGKITTWRGTIQDRPAHAGLFRGRSKGNFKTKALIEGHWRLVDDAMDHIAGQMGKHRDDAPEQLRGMEDYTGQLMRQIDNLPAGQRQEVISQVQFPFPLYHAWREAALDAFHRINTTRRHDLEGWKKLGFVRPVWRFPSVGDSAIGNPAIGDSAPDAQHATRNTPWLPESAFLALPTPQQAIVKSMLDSDPSLLSAIRLSRQEVWNAGLEKLTKLPMELVPELVGPENALNAGEPLTVRRGLFSFDCEDIDPDTIHFYARHGSGEFLPNDEKYVCFVNPYAPSHLIACVPTGSSLKVAAVCARYQPACRTDEAGINRELGAQSAYESQAHVRLNLRHSDQAAAKSAMIETNRALLGNPQSAIRNPQSIDGDITEFLEDPQPSSEPVASATDDNGTDSLL